MIVIFHPESGMKNTGVVKVTVPMAGLQVVFSAAAAGAPAPHTHARTAGVGGVAIGPAAVAYGVEYVTL
jgi:hypothetical protein